MAGKERVALVQALVLHRDRDTENEVGGWNNESA